MRAAILTRLGLAVGLVLSASGGSAAPHDLARLGAGARALALGDAFVAVSDDATAAFWNPAGLAQLQGGEVAFTHSWLAPGWTLTSGSVTFRPLPSRALVAAASGHLLDRAGRPGDDVFGTFPGTPDALAGRGALHVAMRPWAGVQLGAGVARASAAPDAPPSPATWSADAGLLWRAGSTRFGAAARGVDLSPARTSRRLHPGLQVGISQSFAGASLLFAVQGERVSGEPDVVSGGAEWRVADPLCLRAGTRHATGAAGSGEIYCAGFGLRHERFGLDYGWRAASHAASEHSLALRVQLGSAASVEEAESSSPATGADSDAPHAAEEGLARTTRAPTPVEDTAPPPPLPVAPPAPPRDAYARAIAPADAPVAPAPGAAPTSDVSVLAPMPAAGASTPAARPTLPAATTHGPPDAPPANAATHPAASGAASTARFVVRAGIHPDMDSAALEVARLYRGELRPTLERRGKLFIVVVRRCATRAEAAEWQARARKAGVHCSIDEE